MKLYCFPLSTYSQKVMIALYEKNLEFEAESPDWMDPEGRAAYREIYPLGKIPLLIDDDGHMVPESSIIIEYLDLKAEPKLIFGDAAQSRQIRFKDRMFDQYLIESIGGLLFQQWKPEDERDPERIATWTDRVTALYGLMEREMGQQEFSAGDEFSMADCAAAAGLFYAPQVAPCDDYPAVAAYWERLKARPSIRRMHEEAAPVLEQFMQDRAG